MITEATYWHMPGIVREQCDVVMESVLQTALDVE